MRWLKYEIFYRQVICYKYENISKLYNNQKNLDKPFFAFFKSVT